MDRDSSFHCKNCGAEVDPEKKFCTHCGAPIPTDGTGQQDAGTLGQDQDQQPSSRMITNDVIISYSYQNEEDKKTADAVCAALEREKIRCWIAPRDILAGTIYGEDIIQAIDESRIMVLIFSRNSNESRHVMREAERAVSKGLPIIPFRIDDVLPSKHMEYFLSATHWLDALTPPLEEHIQKLVNTVRQLMVTLDNVPTYVPPRDQAPATAAAPAGSTLAEPQAPSPVVPPPTQSPLQSTPGALQPPPQVIPAALAGKPASKKRALLIGVTGLALAIVISVILILVFTLGGSISPAEYREEVKPIHDGFMESCQELYDAYENPPEDTSIAEDYIKLGSLGEDLAGEAILAEETVKVAEAPQEYAGLNESLIDYYAKISDFMDEALPVFSYMVCWDEITAEWFETPYEISNLPESAGISEIAGAVQKDIAIFQSFINRLEGFEVPEQCEGLHENTLSQFKEEQRIFQDMNEAIARNDADALLILLTEWESFGEGQTLEIITTASDTMAFLDQLQDLMGEGEDLQEQIDAVN